MIKNEIIKELTFKALRSSGPGGQHVNKTSSKIEAALDIENSAALTNDEKERLLSKLKSRLTIEGVLLIQVDETRSQHKNKALAIERILKLLEDHLKVPKIRKKTQIPKSVIEKRLKEKRNQALKKSNRKPPEI